MPDNLCAENLSDGSSSHDWPITNLTTGQVGGLCWFCGTSAEAFYERVKEHRRSNLELCRKAGEIERQSIHGRQ